ncbi:hypothetical protein RB195_012990 [Necator americanus]|uniref:Uncharacterized protein n=1 Tax=Necator americanus TaxID=51031 RepID=A0ABR1DTI0_NECAM
MSQPSVNTGQLVVLPTRMHLLLETAPPQSAQSAQIVPASNAATLQWLVWDSVASFAKRELVRCGKGVAEILTKNSGPGCVRV